MNNGREHTALCLLDAAKPEALRLLQSAPPRHRQTQTHYNGWRAAHAFLRKQVKGLHTQNKHTPQEKTALAHLHWKSQRNRGWCEENGCAKNVWNGDGLEWHHPAHAHTYTRRVSSYAFSGYADLYHLVDKETHACILLCHYHHRVHHSRLLEEKKHTHIHRHTHTHTQPTHPPPRAEFLAPLALPLAGSLPSSLPSSPWPSPWPSASSRSSTVRAGLGDCVCVYLCVSMCLCVYVYVCVCVRVYVCVRMMCMLCCRLIDRGSQPTSNELERCVTKRKNDRRNVKLIESFDLSIGDRSRVTNGNGS